METHDDCMDVFSIFWGYLRNIPLLNKSRNQLPKPKMGISPQKKEKSRHKLVYENMIDMLLIRLIWIHVFLSVFVHICD
jgi:hypothetical protein